MKALLKALLKLYEGSIEALAHALRATSMHMTLETESIRMLKYADVCIRMLSYADVC